MPVCKLCLLHYHPTHTCTYTNKDKKQLKLKRALILLAQWAPGSPFLLIYTIYKYIYSHIHISTYIYMHSALGLNLEPWVILAHALSESIPSQAPHVYKNFK